MPKSGWSRFVLRQQTPPFPYTSFWGSFRMHQLQMLSPSPSSSTAFLVSLEASNNCHLFRFLRFSLCGPLGWESPLPGKFPLFIYLCLLFSLVNWPRLGDLFSSPNSREFYAYHFLEQILICTYTIWYYVQISISCTIPNGSPFPPSHT